MFVRHIVLKCKQASHHVYTSLQLRVINAVFHERFQALQLALARQRDEFEKDWEIAATKGVEGLVEG